MGRSPKGGVRTEQCLERLAGGELAAVDLAQDVIECFGRAGHLQVGELTTHAVAAER